MNLLSTKKLTEAQKAHFGETNISLTEYDAISIDFLNVILPSEVENAIFTSQNAVRSIDFTQITIKTCFCVGEKTKQLLEEKGQKVIKSCNYGHELADFLVENYEKDAFYFFCGNLRRDIISEKLKKAKITLFEVKTYETRLNFVKFDQKWDGILFFSPSGVESFSIGNLRNKVIAEQMRNDGTAAICIGKTTASEAKKHFNKVVIAESTSIESVIERAINYNYKKQLMAKGQ